VRSSSRRELCTLLSAGLPSLNFVLAVLVQVLGIAFVDFMTLDL